MEINENWKDIPVIYGVLNPGSDENIDNISGSGRNYDHYVRVQKSFLGDGSALNTHKFLIQFIMTLIMLMFGLNS